MIDKINKPTENKSKKRILTAEGWKRRILRTKQHSEKKTSVSLNADSESHKETA